MRRLETASACIVALALVAAGCERAGNETGGEAAGSAADTASVDTASVDTAAANTDTVSDVALGVDTLEGAGPYLTDSRGRALYLFTPDTAGASTCYEKCASMWPPLTAPEGSVRSAGPVKSGLIGYVPREDGETQVTYGGWPLYYYARDRGSAVASGQDVHGFGGEWYLVTPAGAELHGEGDQSN